MSLHLKILIEKRREVNKEFTQVNIEFLLFLLPMSGNFRSR